MIFSNATKWRFRKKIDIDTPDGCWLWTGMLKENGYGIVTLSKKRYYAHRISWELHCGPIPEKMCVLHKCDHPACVRPDHLFLGTRADNMQDMIQKRRERHDENVRGESHYRARFTEEQVRSIRHRWKLGETQPVLAKEYGVTPGAISHIVTRKNWKHVL